MDSTTLRIEISGDVVEWQNLLNGTQIITLAGGSADGAWTLSGGCSWNVRAGFDAEEGDVTLTRSDGAELFGTLAAGNVTEVGGDDAAGADYQTRLEFDVDDGSGEFAGSSGTLLAEGRLSREGFAWRLIVSVNPS